MVDSLVGSDDDDDDVMGIRIVGSWMEGEDEKGERRTSSVMLEVIRWTS